VSLADRVIAAVDGVNADDPTTIVVDGEPRPKELVHAERMTYWLHRLCDEPTDAQRIAARAHHLRRWVSPRGDYPDGRAGYLRWRAAAKQRHVADITALLGFEGADAALIGDVARIVAKQGRETHADVQAHEDALCLTFCELQLDEMLHRLGHDHTVSVVRKTAAKMSPAGLALIGSVAMSDDARAVVVEATTPTPAPDDR
jgi:hypothetical protein